MAKIANSPVLGLPVAEPVANASGDMCVSSVSLPAGNKGDTYISSLGLPAGLANEFKKTLSVFPSRTWIIDNSGSMATHDGHRIISSGGKVAEVSSTRWEELGDAILWHGSLAAEMGAPTEFRLINPPGLGVPQVLTTGVGDSATADIAALNRLVKTSPTGRTPICQQIRDVTETIKKRAAALRAAGQRHVVIIASDGASTDGDMVEAMRPLQSLPVWVVVRLCTDDDEVVNYWNKIDEASWPPSPAPSPHACEARRGCGTHRSRLESGRGRVMPRSNLAVVACSTREG